MKMTATFTQEEIKDLIAEALAARGLKVKGSVTMNVSPAGGDMREQWGPSVSASVEVEVKP